MKLRISITIIVLILYVGLIDLYIFEFLKWTPYFDKLFYTWLTIVVLAFGVIDWKCGFVNKHHSRFNLLIFISIVFNYLLIIATVSQFFNTREPRYSFYAYDSAVLFVTLTIFFNELKYKILGDPD